MVTQPQIPDRTQRRASKTRNRLLKAALSVFAEVGTDAATIEMITQRADLGKGTFYLHFADKSEIIEAVIEHCVDGLVETISQTAGRPRSLREAVDGLLSGYVEFSLSRQEECILLFQGRTLLKSAQGPAGAVEPPCERYLGRVEELVRPFLPEPVDAMKIRRLACAVAGFVSGFVSFGMATMEPGIVRDSIERVRGVFLDCLVGLTDRL